MRGSLSDTIPYSCVHFGRGTSTVQLLVHRYDLEEKGYRLIVNGGQYQEVPHLHFHLISDGE